MIKQGNSGMGEVTIEGLAFPKRASREPRVAGGEYVLSSKR